ncbi:hypothetical protein BPIT_32680 [Candidatus Brocadia pituitae]|nr:hypothetical protein BPIT_32680 [Candidatus Brocadia pituitae]
MVRTPCANRVAKVFVYRENEDPEFLTYLKQYEKPFSEYAGQSWLMLYSGKQGHFSYALL